LAGHVASLPCDVDSVFSEPSPVVADNSRDDRHGESCCEECDERTCELVAVNDDDVGILSFQGSTDVIVDPLDSATDRGPVNFDHRRVESDDRPTEFGRPVTSDGDDRRATVWGRGCRA
jgi:hypothetical protein